jgi:SAM-dependent methyltransferase
MPQKPANYGTWWRTHPHGAAWYADIYAARQSVHDAFIAWVKATERAAGRPFGSVLEVGCGCAVVYPDVFAGRHYTGFDISEKEIAWCKVNRAFAGRAFICGDFISDGARLCREEPSQGLEARDDLVFSHAVIDHVYDAEAFVDALVKQSKGWLYLTAYRGWFPKQDEHVYHWDDATTCYYNDLSSSKLLTQLHFLGCTNVQVMPFATGKAEIPQETVIIARVPA